jgi:hypothetical protein
MVVADPGPNLGSRALVAAQRVGMGMPHRLSGYLAENDAPWLSE